MVGDILQDSAKDDGFNENPTTPSHSSSETTDVQYSIEDL